MEPDSTPGASRPWFVSAAMIVRNEARHLDEWLAYHQLIGIQHVWIFDNNSTDDLREVLAPWITRGFVTCLYWPHFPGQFDAYSYACRVAAPLTEWLCLFDADEFLALKQVDDLHAYLRGMDCDQVLVRWRMFGHSGHREPPGGLVTETYVHCAPAVLHIVKTIVRPHAVKSASVHFCRTLTKRTCEVGGAIVPEAWAIRRPAVNQVIELNHYYTRSYAEYVAKMERGDANRGEERPVESFERWDFTDRDEGLARLAPAVRARIAAVRAAPTTALRTASMAGGRIPVSSPTLGNLVDRMLDAVARASGLDDTKARLVKSGAGSALEIEPSPPDFAASGGCGFLAAAERLFAEHGVLPLGRLHMDEGNAAKAPRQVLALPEPPPLPGYVILFVAIGASPATQTLRLRVVGSDGSETVQLLERVGVGPNAAAVTARVIQTPCEPSGIELRFVHDADCSGPVEALLGFIL